jgi:aminomethyltransferase
VIATGKLRRTPLHDLHVAAGARMVEFAGWEMPVQYTGVVDEHVAVRQRAGLFDVSHMGEAVVRGRDALALLQRLTCNDVARLAPGRAQYNALTTPRGTFVDDVLIYMLAPGEYLAVLNAGNTAKDLAWLEAHQARSSIARRTGR